MSRSADRELLAACEAGDVRRAKKALVAGANPNATDKYSYPALRAAACKGAILIVRLLLKAGAELDKTDKWGRSAIYCNNARGIRALAEGGASLELTDEDGATPLSYAAYWQESGSSVEALIGAGASLEARRPDGRSVFDMAAQCRSSNNLAVLLRATGTSHRKVISRALHFAARGTAAQHLRLLLEAGANVNSRWQEKTPLMRASAEDWVEGVDLLVKAGASLEGAEEASPAQGKALIRLKSHCIGRARGKALDKALLRAAVDGDGSEVGRALKAGSNPRATDCRGRTALTHASEQGHRAIARRLEIAEVQHSDLSAADRGLLIACIRNRAGDVTRAITKGANLEVRNLSGNTPLTLTAEYDSAKALRALLDAGADPDGGDDYKALHWAALRGHVDCARMLVEAGAVIDRQNDHGETALLIAAAHGHHSLVKLLLLAGARPNITSKRCQTALELAGGGESARMLRCAEEGTLPVAPDQRLTHRCQDCPLCQTLPATCGADLEAGESLPKAAEQLAFFGRYRFCPLCATGYKYDRDRGWYVTGHEDDETLVRLAVVEARKALRKLRRETKESERRNELDAYWRHLGASDPKSDSN